MARKPRDYAAERARAYARAEALGLSRSAALGKPNRGELSKTALGLDIRTKSGAAAAEAKALQAGQKITTRRPVAKARVAGRNVRTGSAAAIQQLVLQLSSRRRVQLFINVTDPMTGARRTIQPWGKGAISAQALQQLIRQAGGLVPAVINAMGQAQAGSTDRDALSASSVQDVTVIYQ